MLLFDIIILGSRFMTDTNHIDETKIINLNPQSLAFVGDAVFSLYIRQRIVLSDEFKPNEEHKLSTQFVKASGQSHIISEIENILTETELKIYKRARNYKTNNVAKNAKVVDYKRATGFEAVLGYLYLTKNTQRLEYIMNLGYNAIQQTK